VAIRDGVSRGGGDPVAPFASGAVRGLFARCAACVLLLAGCDDLFTTSPSDDDLFDAPLDGLSPAELAAFVEGDEQFGVQFRPADGLGPIFNDVSCAACHSGDGRGRRENALVRISRGADPALDVGGPQIQDRAIPPRVFRRPCSASA
jgi:hypothetical protein